MERIQLKYRCLAEIVESSDGLAIVTLTDVIESRALNIVCDKTMCNQLQMRAKQLEICNCMLPEVMSAMLSEYVDLKKLEIMIYDIRDGQYVVTLMNSENCSIRQLRISDAILLHVISGIPMYIDQKLMQAQSVLFQPDMTKVSIPINALDNAKLQEELDKAVEEENYRLASYIQEELNKRKQQNQSDQAE